MEKETTLTKSGWDASVCVCVSVTVCRSVQMVTRGNHHCWSVRAHGGNRRLLYGQVMTVVLDYGVAGENDHIKDKCTRTSARTNGTSAQRNTFHTNLAPWDCERLWGGASGTEREEERTESGGKTERDRHLGFQCSLINEVTPNTSKHTNHTHTRTHTTVTLTRLQPLTAITV